MNIRNYHFHLYYPLAEREQAAVILNQLAKEKPGTQIGTIWDKPVGPHPIGSCQVTVERKDFSEMVEWFLANRKDYSVFIHPDTGHDLEDHTQHVMWMGKEHPLKTEIFKKS